MGLFDKKFCDICGKKIGLLGNKKLADANMCGDCEKKLSNWFSGRKKTTLDDIKEQLAYREANQAELASFRPTLMIGLDNDKFFRMDEHTGKFIILREGEDINKNPDLLDRSLVSYANLEVREDRSEVKTKNEKGESVSFMPPHYSYRYKFVITINYNGRFFDEIKFPLSYTGVNGGTDGEKYTGYAANVRPTIANARQYLPGGYRDDWMTTMADLDKKKYNEMKAMGNQIVEALTSISTPMAQASDVSPDEWKCGYCGSMSVGKFCGQCGAPRE